MAFDNEIDEDGESTFSPFDILENLKKSNLDPSIFETIDERDFPKAPNFLEFAIGPKFLNTLILPKQVEIGAKLFCDYCPRCSKPNYIDTLFDQSVGNIRDNVVFLEHGVCPKCSTNRFELIKSRELIFRNELVGVAGQRCIPHDSLVFTDKGIKELSNIVVSDNLTHGTVLEKYNSGKLPSLRLTTKYNYTLVGSKDSHIVPVLKLKGTGKYTAKTKWKADFEIDNVAIKDCKLGDILLLHTPDMWPTQRYVLPEYTFVPTSKQCRNFNTFIFPREVTPELARIIGYMIANGDNSRKYNFRVTLSSEESKLDFIRCCQIVFDVTPTIDEIRSSCTSYSVNGLALMEWLDQSVRLCLKTARFKTIPDCILQSPKDVVCEFLSALFECDGNIYLGKDSSSVRVQYASVSKKLIKQVRLLLLNLGVVTRCDKFQSGGFGKNNIYTENVEEGKEVYSLSTKNSQFVTRFKNSIKFVSKQKSEALATVKDTGQLTVITPVGQFRFNSFSRWPSKLQKLYIEGYFPVAIENIEEGFALDMLDVSIPNTNLYTADGFVHHNSGKTKLVGLLAAYINHRFLKIPNPIRMYNQTSGDMLLGTFSALSLDHAYRNLWQAFKGFIDSSPWFQNYHRFIKGEEKRLGIELLHELKTSIMYSHKHLMWNATGSQDRKMRGDTRIFGAIDELGWMISDEQKADLQNMNADAIYTALSNSLTTMRAKYRQIYNSTNFDVPPIFMANISSPSSVKDKIMRLSKEAKRNDRIFAFNLPTWACNPDYTYESLREEMSHIDELTFLRDFAAEPPIAANPYISEPKLIDKIATGEQLTLTCSEYTEKDFMGDPFKSAKLVVTKSDKNIPRLVSFDLGSMKNSLAVCLFSLTADSKPKLDFAFSIRPEKGIRANIAKFFEDFTVPLVTNFKIKHAFFDRWQSLDQIERLKSMGVQAQIHSLTYKEMDSLRGTIISQSIVIPKLQYPMDKYVREYIDDVYHIDSMGVLGLQLLTVRDLGHKMSKPLLGDDDIFRAFCLGAVKLSEEAIKKEYMNNGATVSLNSGHNVAHLGVIRTRRNVGNSGITSVEGDNGKHLGSLRTRHRK